MKRTHLALATAAVLGIFVACSGSTGDGVISPGGTSGVSGTPCVGSAASACGGQKCDAALGCVECLVNGDCGAGKPICVRGRCGECQANVDCPATKPACWPADRECHVPCKTNDDCTSGGQGICDVGTGQCVGCRAAPDCSAAAPICDAASRRCVACAVNADCGAGKPFCAVARGRCVECLGTNDCGAANPYCHPDELACGQAPCTSDAQCGGATSRCDTAKGSCVACVSAAHCQAPTPVCSDSRCVECKDDVDCPAAKAKCKDRRCEAN